MAVWAAGAGTTLSVCGSGRGGGSRFDLAFGSYRDAESDFGYHLPVRDDRGADEAGEDGAERADAAGAPSGACREDLRFARLSFRRTDDHGGGERQRSARFG